MGLSVTLVIRRFMPELGGAEQWTFRLAQRLLHDGHTVHVIATEGRALPHPSFRLHLIHTRRLSESARKLAFASEAELLARRLSCDVVHDQGDGWWGDLLQPHGGVRRRSIQQNLARKSSLRRMLRRWLAPVLPRYRAFARLERRQFDPHADRLYIAVSDLVAEDLRRFYQIPDPKIRIVYNGVDVERFHPSKKPLGSAIRERLGLSKHETVFVFLANNFLLKGGPQLLEALAELRRRRLAAKLLLLGRMRVGPVVRAVRALGLEQDVRIVGSVEDPVPFYAAADVCVHPTFSDSCSLVALEALAMGLPVITTAYNGVAPIIERFGAGCVFADPRDINQLVHALELASQPSWREATAVQARQAAEAHSWDRNYQEILAVYEEVASQRRRLGFAA